MSNGKRKRRAVKAPVMLLWTKRDQRRFSEAVERFQSLVNDLETILAPAKRKQAMKKAAATLLPPSEPQVNGGQH